MDAYVDDLFDSVFDQGPPVSIIQFKYINIIVQFIVKLAATLNSPLIIKSLFYSNWAIYLLIFSEL